MSSSSRHSSELLAEFAALPSRNERLEGQVRSNGQPFVLPDFRDDLGPFLATAEGLVSASAEALRDCEQLLAVAEHQQTLVEQATTAANGRRIPALNRQVTLVRVLLTPALLTVGVLLAFGLPDALYMLLSPIWWLFLSPFYFLAHRLYLRAPVPQGELRRAVTYFAGVPIVSAALVVPLAFIGDWVGALVWVPAIGVFMGATAATWMLPNNRAPKQLDRVTAEVTSRSRSGL
jgi:hypothetical protein